MSGVLLVLLGLWGGLIPLVGPYVHYAYTPNHAWRITSGRVWLEILPAAGTLLGGLILLASKLRPMALLGASLAVASGAWFAVGTSLAPLWTSKLPAEGAPVGGHIVRVMEQIGFFAGLGVAIVCIASVALGRLSMVTLRDRRTVERPVAEAAAETTGTTAEADSGASSRWPGPRAMTMRRVASSGRKEASAGASDSAEAVASASSKR